MKTIFRIRFLDFKSDNRKAGQQTKCGPADKRRPRRLKWVGVVAVAFAMCGAVAQAQQRAKISKIGYLGAGSAQGNSPRLWRMLRDHDYVEGKNIAIEYRYAVEVGNADKFESAFKAAIKARRAALAVTHHQLAVSNRKQIADLAIKYRLPAIYGREDYVDSGGLMSYGADDAERLKRAAVMIDKILKGTKPAEIPVEQPMRFEFIVNLIAAKQIGLTVPPNVLVRAQKVIR